MKHHPGVVGISEHEEPLVRALEQLHRSGYRNIKTYSPIPSDRLSEGPEDKKSPVRFFTLIGGILGFTMGLGFTIWTVLQWPLITGGKPIISLPAFLVVAFELTILIGGISTFAGMVIQSRLIRTLPKSGYDERFSVDRFGIFVPCKGPQAEEVKKLFHAAGVEEMVDETA